MGTNSQGPWNPSVASAQVNAAAVENARLSMQAELATDYYMMRGLDGEKKLLDDSTVDYQKALDLTRNRMTQGVASGIDVAQAETQLATTQAQATDTGVLRAQYEHAIAILIGESADRVIDRAACNRHAAAGHSWRFTGRASWSAGPISPARAERQTAAANAQIGVALATFYPTLTLSATGGMEGTSLLNLISWPSRVFSLGPSLTQIFYDAGRRRAVTAEAAGNLRRHRRELPADGADGLSAGGR